MMRNRLGVEVEFRVDQNCVRELKRYRESLGDRFPKFGVLVVSYNSSDLISATTSRIPLELFDLIEQVFIFDDCSCDDTYDRAWELLRTSPWKSKLRVFRNPRNLGYGGNQKVGFQYAIDCGFDYVVLLHGDGQYAPESLPEMMLPVLADGESVVFGSRMMARREALRGGMPLYKWLGNQALTRFENAILALKLTEYHSGYRIYATAVLRQIPFLENTDDFHWDSQIIVQLRAAGVRIREISIPTFYGHERCHVSGLRYAWDVCRTVIEYRLHQLHLIRRSRYYLKREVVYTRKRSRFGSHRQILSLVSGGGLALDLGADDGLLTEPLLARGVKSVGVGGRDPVTVRAPFEQYHQADLEDASSLDYPRQFDYVILPDVIEHVRHARELLWRLRGFLKPEGSLIVSVPNIALWFYRLALAMGRFNYGPKGVLDETHVRLYTFTTIRDLLNETGYVVRRVRPASLPFEVVFESTGQSRLVRLLDRLYYGAARIWPRMFAYQFIVEAQISSLQADKGEGQILP